jgi:hypothetical protein
MVHRIRKSFEFVEDAGHGWVKVPKSLLAELGIASQITDCSYQRGEYAYLEEDTDRTLFENAFKEKFGVSPNLRERVVDNSRIRNYEPYVGGRTC